MSERFLRSVNQRIAFVIVSFVLLILVLGGVCSAVFGAEWYGVTYYGWDAIWRYTVFMLLTMLASGALAGILVLGINWAVDGESR